MIEAFSLDRINKTSGRFDREKLLAMNTLYAAAATPERLRAGFRDFAEVRGSPLGSLDDATLARVLAVCHGFRTFRDVENKAGALFVPDEQLDYEPDAVRKVLEKKEGAGYAMLERLLPGLEALATWTPGVLEALIKDFCEQAGAKMGDVAQPVRVAISGRTISPAIGDALALLGKEKALRRIRACLSRRAAAC
jgi:glutamyl-tRNA synthetase